MSALVAAPLAVASNIAAPAAKCIHAPRFQLSLTLVHPLIADAGAAMSLL